VDAGFAEPTIFNASPSESKLVAAQSLRPPYKFAPTLQIWFRQRPKKAMAGKSSGQ